MSTRFTGLSRSGHSLRPYQERAAAALLRNDRFLLLLDMGMGKTATTLTALLPGHLPAIVVSTKRIVESTWPEELEEWRPDLSFRVASGTLAKRRAAIEDTSADILLISQDNLHTLAPKDHARFRTVIFDEISLFKSPGSRKTKAAHRVVKGKDTVWGLTGTPAAERLSDIWSPVKLVDGGKRLETSQTKFFQKYYIPEYCPFKKVKWETLKPGAEDAIFAAVDDISLTMLSRDYLDLPELVFNDVRVRLPKHAREAYDEMRDTMLLGEEVTAANAGAKASKLLQISAGFAYKEDGTAVDIHTAKMDALAELVEQAQSPVLVFYTFRREASMIAERFGAPTELGKGVKEQWDEGKLPLLALHVKSGAHGLNLQRGGHTIVWTTPPYSSELEQQANKRLHRPGQRHTVVVHTLRADVPIDSYVASKRGAKEERHERLLAYLRGVSV